MNRVSIFYHIFKTLRDDQDGPNMPQYQYSKSIEVRRLGLARSLSQFGEIVRAIFRILRAPNFQLNAPFGLTEIVKHVWHHWNPNTSAPSNTDTQPGILNT